VKTVRTAQAAAFGISIYFFIVLAQALITTGFTGGIYGSTFAPFWIFSPALVGMFINGPLTNSGITRKGEPLRRRSIAYLIALGVCLAFLGWYLFILRNSPDKIVSISIIALVAPAVFFLVYGAGFVANSIRSRRSAPNP